MQKFHEHLQLGMHYKTSVKRRIQNAPRFLT